VWLTGKHGKCLARPDRDLFSSCSSPLQRTKTSQDRLNHRLLYLPPPPPALAAAKAGSNHYGQAGGGPTALYLKFCERELLVPASFNPQLASPPPSLLPRFCVCLANKSTCPFPPTVFHLIHRLRRADEGLSICCKILVDK
jgi:hypothetical protein